MTRFVAILVVCFFGANAFAQCPNCGKHHSRVGAFVANVDTALAQHKAELRARIGVPRLHVGGGLGSGRFEGVGYSPNSADEAIRSSCYWGHRTPTGIGVARGPRGWYATVIYQ